MQVSFEWGNVLGNSSVDGTQDPALWWLAVLVVLKHRVLLPEINIHDYYCLFIKENERKTCGS